MTTPAARMFTSGQLRRFNCDDCSKPCRVRLPCVNVIVDNESRLRRCYVARSQNISTLPYQEKIILLVGETGAGKTTLINSLVNYYYRTQWDDEFRLVLIAEEDEGNEGVIRSQSESQTNWITAYTLHCQPNCAVGYTLTVIDTPGYNDPRGVQCDTNATKNLSKFFNLSNVDHGIDQIDAVGFVVLSSQHRLTSAQKYVFHSVLSVFGKDIGENIVLMATHVDSKESNATEAAKAGGIPYRECVKFNNSVLLRRNEKKSQEEDASDDDDDLILNKILWKNNMKSMKDFFQMLDNLEPKSLKLTKEVLRQRQRLQTMLQNHQEEIITGLTDLINLKKKSEYLRHCNSTLDVDTNVEQEYIESRKLQPIALPKFERATNCDICKFTCHYPCTQEKEELWRCRAMNYYYYEALTVFLNLSSPRTTNCNICPKKCSFSSHSSADFRYKYVIEKLPLNLESIRKNHQSEGEALSTEELNLRIEQQSAKTRVQVYRILIETNTIILCLDEIALKPQVAEVNHLMQAMIDEEVQSSKDGWKERVDQLKCLMQHDQLIQEIRRKFAD